MTAPSPSSAARVFTIASNAPFLNVLAESLLDDVSRHRLFAACEDNKFPFDACKVLLPTRRAARAFAETCFAQAQAKGRDALILPEIMPLGDVNEDGFVHFPHGQNLAELDHAPALDPQTRHFWLMQCVEKYAQINDLNLPVAQLSTWVTHLERLLDEGYNQAIDWQDLANLNLENFASNWQQTLEFLKIITEIWPAYLESQKRLDPTDRRNRLLRAQAQAWAHHPPESPIIAAGSTGTIAATGALLKTIAHLPHGAVILPGLDLDASPATWEAIRHDPRHPQFAMAALLDHIGVRREMVTIWADSAPANAREQLLNRALAPAGVPAGVNGTGETPLDIEAASAGLDFIEAPDLHSEAGLIATYMRETLESTTERAALITHDRQLARRVAAELRRWDIEVDDSAGAPLAHKPAAVFLQLICAAHASNFDAIDLLALLKHPFCMIGLARKPHLDATRVLERAILREPTRAGGLAVLQEALNESKLPTKKPAQNMLARLIEMTAPMCKLQTGAHELTAHIDALEACAAQLVASDTGDDANHIATLYQNFDGRAVQQFFDDLRAHCDFCPALTSEDWRLLLADWLARKSVRLPQARAHPRLFIWSPSEARLIQTERVILGGLNEAVWPPNPDTGPWLSRPMRAEMNLAAPEQRVGLSAHDFVASASNAHVILTRAKKIDGAPTIASRWLRRLHILMQPRPANADAEASHTIKNSPAAMHRLHWWRALDSCAHPKPASRPQPCPPQNARPAKLSVTRIEALLANPYQIYASHILNLYELDPISAPITPARRGGFLHAVFEKFSKNWQNDLPDNIQAALLQCADEIAKIHPGGDEILLWWRARINAIADWFAAYERANRANLKTHWAEIHGEVEIDIDGTPFTITAKADRIEQCKDGSFNIVDYKTGGAPSQKQVRGFWSPQLTLEAAILEAGGFADIPAGHAKSLKYIRLSGGVPAGAETSIDADNLAQGARHMVVDLIRKYRKSDTPYVAFLRPEKILYDTPYHQLARKAEWASEAED